MSQETQNARINCTRCEHFYITWDARFPRGCKAYEFKTQSVPSAVVKRSSGMSCMMFKAKARGER